MLFVFLERSMVKMQLKCLWSRLDFSSILLMVWMLCNPRISILYCMSNVQFCWHFWPLNFTYGYIVCLAGPWIRAPFLESCWDKNLGTATPYPSSDRRWQTKGHRDENGFHCTFKACTAESDCLEQWLCDFPKRTFIFGSTQRPEC